MVAAAALPAWAARRKTAIVATDHNREAVFLSISDSSFWF
jgi:hypothetical protein